MKFDFLLHSTFDILDSIFKQMIRRLITNIEHGMSNNEVQRTNRFSGHPWGGPQPPSSPDARGTL